jgi:GMP synthase (glutamine-hydrolysing)
MILYHDTWVPARQKIYHHNALHGEAMRILVVNNYGQFNHLIRRAIREKVETDLISNQTPPEKIDANGLILGGGPNLDRAGRCADYLRDLDIPILGICLGMQLMGTTFGGKVVPGSVGGYAEVEVQVLKEDDILRGLPSKFKTWASHMDQVIELPQGFEVLARSDVCEIEAMKHLTRPLYGVQWHPEVVHTDYGAQLLDNFIALCRR